MNPTPGIDFVIARLAAMLRPDWPEGSIFGLLKTREFSQLSDAERARIVVLAAVDPTARTPKALLHTAGTAATSAPHVETTAAPTTTRICSWCGSKHQGPDRLKCPECQEISERPSSLSNEDIQQMLDDARAQIQRKNLLLDTSIGDPAGTG